MTLRAAIIGCGRVGIGRGSHQGADLYYTHAGAYHRLPRVDLIAVADVDPARLALSKKAWGVKRLYRDYRQMLNNEQLDIISICVPNPLHSACITSSVKASVRAIFCEKPLGLNYHQTKRAVELCRQKGIVLAVNHQRHWEPGHQRLAQLIRSKKLGQIQLVRGLYYGDWWTIGSHAVDLIRFLFGEPMSWQVSYVKRGPKPAFDVNFQIKGGPQITLQVCRKDTYQIFEWDVIGTQGRVQILNSGHEFKRWKIGQSAEYGDRELVSDKKRIKTNMRAAFSNALKDTIDCIGQKRMPACSGDNAAKTVHILEAVAHQAERYPC